MSTSLKTLVPFAILIALITLLYQELFNTKSNELPSALIGQTVPVFHLPTLTAPEEFFDNNDLKNRVSLLNVWATWCYACRVEHEMLMKIAHQYHVPIYGINYKDDIQDAKKWLQNSGNPYIKNGIDAHGDVAIDLGIYGTPETFIINAAGEIVYRHIGVITQQVWDEKLYPAIQHFQNNA